MTLALLIAHALNIVLALAVVCLLRKVFKMSDSLTRLQAAKDNAVAQGKAKDAQIATLEAQLATAVPAADVDAVSAELEAAFPAPAVTPPPVDPNAAPAS